MNDTEDKLPPYHDKRTLDMAAAFIGWYRRLNPRSLELFNEYSIAQGVHDAAPMQRLRELEDGKDPLTNPPEENVEVLICKYGDHFIARWDAEQQIFHHRQPGMNYTDCRHSPVRWWPLPKGPQ